MTAFLLGLSQRAQASGKAASCTFAPPQIDTAKSASRHQYRTRVPQTGFSVTSSVYKEIAGEVTEKTFRYRLCSRYYSVEVESWMLQAQVWR
ncbi:MAG TPA: hypothetical protein VFE27_17790, partial [Acidobacteriaceae bacterium]|nr:hypothetical protein [Acidobacteriaceae bacterium]